MFKVSTFVLAAFVCATAFLTLSAFNNQNSSTATVSTSSKSGEREWVHIRFNRIGGRTFTIDGAINTSGTWSMAVDFTGVAFHCVNTLTSSQGTLVALSNCNFTTMYGVWHIVDGTGVFAGLKGNGYLIMFETAAGVPTGEDWYGTIK